MKAHLAKVSLALLSAAFLLGCQEQGSEPVGPEGLGPEFAAPACKGPNKNDPGCPGTTDPDGGETFDVTIRTCNKLDEAFLGGPCAEPGNEWTVAPQEVQAKSGNWLHVWDTGGNGTRGRPKYPGTFETKIFLKPVKESSIQSCAGDGGSPSLLDKLNQDLDFRVFDFQVGYDIADNPDGFSFFLFRWEDADGTFSASTGFGSSGADPAPSIDFLGDNNDGTAGWEPDDITDPAIERVFRITGAKVIAQELDKNKVIRMFECLNEHIIEVTVAPHVTP